MAKTAVTLHKKSYEALEQVASKKGVAKGAFLSKLLTELELNNEGVKPVVLHIPVSLLTGHKEELQEWLETRANGILNHYYSE